MRKRIISFLLVFCMLFSMFPAGAISTDESKENTVNAVNPFTDVSQGDWYYDAVQYARVNGFFSGTSATTFSPDGTMTRGMFVTVLGCMAGVDTAAYMGQSAFDDVPADQYYAPYVAWAAKHGITSGTGDKEFSPEALINREQMAAFFVRYFETFNVNYDTGANITTTPADIDTVSPYARDAVLKLWKQGLLSGDGKNFDPSGNASRAQAATLCRQADKAVEIWYREPGVASERVSVEPGEVIDPTEPEKPEEPKKPNKPSDSDSDSSTTTYYFVEFELGAGQDGITGVKLPENKVYAAGTKIDMLPTPYKQDYVFLGWYYNEAMTEQVGSSDVVSRNTTLYAKMSALTSVSELETPNYVTKTDVPAGSYSFDVTGVDPAIEGTIKIINITAGNEEIKLYNESTNPNGYTVSGSTVTLSLKAGQTYRVELLNEAACFRLSGDSAPQPASVRYLNLITKMAEVNNLQLDNGVKCIPFGEVKNVNGALEKIEGLFTAVITPQGETTVTGNEYAGTFTYTGSQTLAVGDIVAIYSGKSPKLRTGETQDDGTVAYVEITAIDGTSYSYKTAESEDVLFTPDILPVSTAADTDGDNTNYSITVSEDTMDFSADVYAEMGLDSQTTIDVGDFIAFYDGSLNGSAEKQGYAKIKSVEKENGSYVIGYQAAGEDEILAVMDLYSERNEKITLTDEEQNAIKQDIVAQAESSGFVESAATYLTALALETDGFQELSEDLDMDLESYAITFADGTPLEEGDMALMAGSKVTIKEKKIEPQISFGRNVCQHFEGKDGILVALNLELTIDIGGKAELKLTAGFTQEFLIMVNARGGAVWKWKWIFPYIADYQLNANIDVGAYTGIGITATIKTVAEDDDDKFDWKPVTDNKAEERIINIGKQIKDLMEQEEKFLQKDVVGGGDDDDDDDDGGVSGVTLAEKYASMIEDAEDSWIEIFTVKIMESEGNVDPLHILCYGIKAQFVVKANLYVTIGMTFEYGIARRYNFSISLFKRTATTETIDLEESHYNFDFYVMGTIGIRAGIELEIAVGLFSLKLDSVGICAELGAYAQMWGYFYYHASWSESEGKTSGASGALALEIGVYLTVSFKAQAFSSKKLTYQPTLYDNSWPILTVGSIENVYDFAYEDDDPQLSMDIQSVDTFTVPSTLFDMKYMDMKSGDIYGEKNDDGEYEDEDKPAKNFDSEKAGENEEHFKIELSNPKFSYQARDNSITIDPKGSADETCEMTITWKGGALVFTSKPIQRTVKIKWSDPANVRYISFDSKGGSTVPMISKGVDKPVGTLPEPTKVGYKFAGWYMANDAKFAPPETMLNDWTVAPYSSSDMKGITVYAKWTPRDDTKFTVEHYVQELNGTYTKTDRVDTLRGYTDSTITNGSGENSKTVTYLAPRTSGTDTATKPNVSSKEENPKYTVDFTKYTPKAFAAGQTIAPNGSTVVKIYYDRKTYSVRFTYGARESSDNQPLTYTAKYGATVYAPKLALGGYDFTSFSGLTDEQMKNGVTVMGEGQSYDAQWTPSADTPFRVEHYVQRTTDDTYVLYGDNAIQSASGTTDDEINIETYKLSESGLTYQYATVGGKTVGTGEGQVKATIGADGKTVVKLYYNRKSFDLILMNGETQISSTSTVYGSVLKTPTAPEKQGYDFAGWYTDADCTDGNQFIFGAATMPAQTLTLYAKWAPGDNTKYTVEHWQQKLDNEAEYTKVATDEKKGLTDTDTAAEANTYEGFTAKSFEQEKIAADGTTVVKIYYDRNPYDVTFNSNGGSDVEKLTGIRYGATITRPNDPTKQGYAFVGWYKDSNLTDDWDFAVDTMPASDTTLYAKWEPKGDTAYTVKHYEQALDGSYPETPTETENKTGVTGQQTKATVKTYTGFTAPNSITQKTIAADGSTVVEIKYTRNKYTLTFDPANGTESTVSQVYYEAPISAPTSNPAKTGYTFAGWGDVADKMPATDTTYTAKWTANSYTVAFEKNAPDGVEVGGSTASQTFTYDQAQNLRANGFTLPANSGYTFVGWATTANGTKAYNDGQSVSNLTAAKNGTVTLYAVWQQGESVQYTVNHYQQNVTGDDYTLFATQTLNGVKGTLTAAAANSYTGFNAKSFSNVEITGSGIVVDIYYDRVTSTITFDTDGGSTISPITARFGATVKAPADPSKTGYAFVKWLKNGAEATVPATMPAENITLTAQWQINQYTITFDTDGGNEIAPITQNFDTAISAPANPTKTGYTFVKWLKNGAEATVPAKMPAENIELTAQWQVNRYTITFNTDGGSEIPAITKNYGENVGTVANPTKTGYTFKGWDTEIPATMLAENKTITAKWTANTWTVTFDPNDGDALDESKKTKSVTYDSTYGELPTPTKAGYSFGGWSLNDTKVTDSTVVKTDKDHTLTANWTRNDYTIRYTLNGGSVETANHTSYTVESGAITLTNPTRTGYTFTGWTGTGLSEATETVTIPAGSTGNRTYTANWTAIEYSITYNLDDGAFEVTPATTYTIEDAFTFTAPTKTGYTFGGWYTDSGFTTPITGITKDSTGNLTLYAKWEENTFTVNYILGVSDVTINNPNPAKPPINKEITLQDPTREGWTFDGWYAESTFENRVTTIQASNTTTKKDLYAKWKCVVTYDFDGVDDSDTVDVTPGDTVALPEIPTKYPTVDKTYTILGWSADGGNTKLAAGTEVEVNANVTYKAIYQESDRVYTVQWKNNDGATVSEGRYTYDAEIQVQSSNKASSVDAVYTHSGWKVGTLSYKTDKTSGTMTLRELFNGENPSLTEDLIPLFPRFSEIPRLYTVTFVTHTGQPITKEVKVNTPVENPMPTYIHNGVTYSSKWYTSSDMSSNNTAWDFENNKITGATTLFARWYADGATDYDGLTNSDGLGLVVGGFGVNDSNAADIPLPEGMTGKASYDKETKVLTLTNVSNVDESGNATGSAHGYKDYFIYIGIQGVTIKLVGDCKLRTPSSAIYARALTIQGDNDSVPDSLSITSRGYAIWIRQTNVVKNALTVDGCTLNVNNTVPYGIYCSGLILQNNANVTSRSQWTPLGSNHTITFAGPATLTLQVEDSNNLTGIPTPSASEGYSYSTAYYKKGTPVASTDQYDKVVFTAQANN